MLALRRVANARRSKGMFKIRLFNVGEEPAVLLVYGDDSYRRPAVFFTADDAMECCRVIAMLRTDSAYEGSEVFKD